MKYVAVAAVMVGSLGTGVALTATHLAGHHGGAARVTAMPPFCVVTAQTKGGPQDGLCVWIPGLP